jgi:hypothetical protein
MAWFPPLAALLLLATAAQAAPPAPGERAAPLAATDALGRELAVPIPGRVLLLSFASPATGEAAGEIARALRVAHPDLEILSFIDLSSYPRLMHGFVRREIVKRQRGGVEETRAAFAAAGKVAPEDLAERVHVIPDFDAQGCRRYGADEAGALPLLVLVGADGLVKATLVAPSPAAVTEAVERVAGEPPH